MNTGKEQTALRLVSLVKKSGELELSLTRVPIPAPLADEVLVRIEGSPINPSDLGLLLAGADLSTARQSGTPAQPVITAGISEDILQRMAGRIDQAMPVGNEGAGLVVSAGASDEAQALLGKTVAIFGGAMYAQYRSAKARHCLVLPAGTSAAEGASCFVNPLTSQGMVETMRLEGHKALVHTAAASNLGQMLHKICAADKIGLVNIVRTEQQAELLRGLGATYVCNSSAPTFTQDLTKALVATGATLAFDAIGGGELAGQILSCMETALNRNAKEYSRYGSTVHKQVYIYGSLNTSPIVFKREFGSAWGIGGWLLTAFLQKIGNAATRKLRERVVAELKTTFASHYTKEISLAGALRLEEIAVYSKRATGAKYLINPNKGVAS